MQSISLENTKTGSENSIESWWHRKQEDLAETTIKVKTQLKIISQKEKDVICKMGSSPKEKIQKIRCVKKWIKKTFKQHMPIPSKFFNIVGIGIVMMLLRIAMYIIPSFNIHFIIALLFSSAAVLVFRKIRTYFLYNRFLKNLKIRCGFLDSVFDKHSFLMLFQEGDSFHFEKVPTHINASLSSVVFFIESKWNGSHDFYYVDGQSGMLGEIGTVFLEQFQKAIAIYREKKKLTSKLISLKASSDGIKIRKEAWNHVFLPDETTSRLIKLSEAFLDGKPYASKGLLLYGPPGTGKSMIAKVLSETAGCAFISLTLSDLKKGHVGQSAQEVKKIWMKARFEEKVILFIDECDSIFSKRGGENSDGFIDEIVGAFLPEWDGLNGNDRVWVIGATNRKTIIDPAILSRFDDEIEIGLPDEKARLEILSFELQKDNGPIGIFSKTAERTIGFSGRDLRNIAVKVKRDLNDSCIVTDNDIQNVLNEFRKKHSSKTNVHSTWDTLILDDKEKKSIFDVVNLLKHADIFSKKGISLPKGILLYGEPGTGKTEVARTISNESGLQFIGAALADLKAKWVGHSAIKVKEIFERARQCAPAILFIDEIDLVAPTRGGGSTDTFHEEMIGQLLQEMDGISEQQNHVFVLAATNRIDQIDKAVLSRFEQCIKIPLPSESSRVRILEVFLKQKPHHVSGDCLRNVSKQMDGCSGRDLKNMCQNAERKAVRRALKENKPESVCIFDEDFDF